MTSVYAGRIGVVIETAPGHFMTVVLRGTKANIHREADEDTRWGDTYRRFVASDRIRIELEGYLIDQAEATGDDAAWVTQAAAEIEAAPRELTDHAAEMGA
jgi:hypothetical protein